MRIVAQEGEHSADLVALDLDGQLAKRDLRGQKRRAEAFREISAELVQGSSIMHPGLGRLQRSMVPVRRIFFCRSRTP